MIRGLPKQQIATFVLGAFFATPNFASDLVKGTATTFTSPNGQTETCVRIDHIPGGMYQEQDLSDEVAYCSIDFYAPDTALCPKTWSTSPGMMVFDVSGGTYANDRNAFEREACREGKSARDLASSELAKFKSTMNAKGTSGTFAPSSLLYYHFSRYFDATVKVPVAVWRSMDAAAHLSEVASSGLALSGSKHGGRMNHAGWRTFVDAEMNPKKYRPTDDLFTSDRKQIYGVLLLSPGHRYASEINGTRKSGWGKGQNNDFQKTPAFLALRLERPLVEAIEEGVMQGRKDRQIAKDLSRDVTDRQMVYWMKELTEIVLLDFIFSQQDRVGNIDFTPYYYWLDGGKLTHKKAKHHEQGDGTVPADAEVIRRTNLNDNDAGGKVQYANFAKTTQMLEKLRHMDGDTYRKLIELTADLQNGGAIFEWLNSSLGLSNAEVAQVVKNTNLATAILQESCEEGKIRFDLSPKVFFETGTAKQESVACGGS